MPDYTIPNNPFLNMQIPFPQAFPTWGQAMDQFQEITPERVMKLAAVRDQMDENKLRQRIYQEQLQENEEARNYYASLQNPLKPNQNTLAMMGQGQQGPQGQAQPQNALAGMSGGLPMPQNRGGWGAMSNIMETQQKAMAQKAAMQEQQLAPLQQDALSRLISTSPGTAEHEQAKRDYFAAGGKNPQVIKSLLAVEKTDKPLSDVGKLQFDRKRLIDSGVPEDDPQVKAFDAEIEKKSERAETKEPASTEANYRQGLEQKMREAHPDWPEKKIQFEAAAQVRKENIQNQRANFEIRIPTQQQATDMPPGYTFDRRSGKFRAPDGSLVSPNDFSKLYADKAEMLGEKKAMGDLIKREQLIKTFTNRIDANVDLFNNFKTSFKNNWPRIANLTIRQAYTGAIGSGDAASLRQILFSIESEVAKVETGNIGIAGVAEGAREITAKIHDLNMPIKELEKVLDTSKKLSKTASAAMQKQRKELKGDLAGGGGSESKVEPRKPGESIADYLKRTGQ